jgi:hypothetical protein
MSRDGWAWVLGLIYVGWVMAVPYPEDRKTKEKVALGLLIAFLTFLVFS